MFMQLIFTYTQKNKKTKKKTAQSFAVLEYTDSFFAEG